MITFPNAKINLGLHVLEKREDGFHNIESCFYPIPWYDSLEIIPNSSFNFQSYGLTIPGDSLSNLCMKAYNLLKEEYRLPPIEIHLLKGIPMGAGLGGGSADGAFVLNMLNKLFELNLNTKALRKYALELGSDCPFFIENKPAIASGRGERLTLLNLDLKGYHLAIYNPGIHISTKQAYAGVTPQSPDYSISDLVSRPIIGWKESLINDFEASIFSNYPEIAQIKEEMYEAGALYSSMTGSGSTVFGIFKERIETNPWRWMVLN